MTEVLSELKTFSHIELSMDSNSTHSLDELLELSPVYLKNYGQGQLATLSIRGNGASQTQVFWNGFKMNSPSLGQTDLSLIPVFFLSNARINYSGGSSVNGSGGIGGSVDLSNQLNWQKGVVGMAGVQLASFTNSTARFQLSFVKNKVFQQLKMYHSKGKNDFGFTDVSDIQKPKVFQENNQISQQGGQYEIGMRMNKKNLIQGTVLFFNSHREIPPVLSTISNKETQEDKSVKSFVSWKSFQDNFTSDLRVSYFKEQLNYTDSISSIFSTSNINTYQAQWRSKFKLLKVFDVETSLGNSLYQVESSGFSQEKTRNELGLYSKISETLPKLYYEVFARQELIDVSFSPIMFGGGFAYSPFKKKIELRGSIASVFRLPTLNDLYWAVGGNESLLPEKGWNSELSISYKKTKKPKEWSTSITGFYNETENWIQWVPTNTGVWSPRNVKKITNAGVELSVNYSCQINDFSFGLLGFYSFTHSMNRISENSNTLLVGKMPIYIPNHKASGTFGMGYKKISLTYSQIYNGRVFCDESNSAYMPHYFPANISLEYRLKLKSQSLFLKGKINNLYNEQFQVVANRPVAGRNYSFDISYFF
ncbi:MAG: TonB-dependent receptor [Flavobacteriales bacterium]